MFRAVKTLPLLQLILWATIAIVAPSCRQASEDEDEDVEDSSQPTGSPTKTARLEEKTTDLNALAQAADEGATVVVPTGRYRLQEIEPKDGQTFVAKGEVILSGAELIDDFSIDSEGRWVMTGIDSELEVHGSCEAGYESCGRPEGVFIDDDPLWQVDSLADLASGSFFIDYDADTLYLFDDPTDRTVELSTAEHAFAGSASGVTIKGFIVEKYANRAQTGAIHGEEAGGGWKIIGNEARYNHGGGISIGSDGLMQDNDVHHNGHLGATGGGTSLRVLDNEFSYNTIGGFDAGWEGGGAKFTVADGLLVKGNYSHHNHGPGLWTDIDCIDVTYDGNTVELNDDSGIFHEISYEAVIKNNIVRNNGVDEEGWAWGAQILIAASQDVEVFDNEVTVAADHGTGILMIQQDRGDGAYGHYELRNNSIHGNTVTLLGNDGLTGAMTDLDPSHADYDSATTGGNSFDDNTYILSDAGSETWIWGGDPLDWTAFQAAGNETGGTLQAP